MGHTANLGQEPFVAGTLSSHTCQPGSMMSTNDWLVAHGLEYCWSSADAAADRESACCLAALSGGEQYPHEFHRHSLKARQYLDAVFRLQSLATTADDIMAATTETSNRMSLSL